MDLAEARELLSDRGLARLTQRSFDLLPLSEVVLDGQWFDGCSFVSTDLRGASLRSAFFNGCDFRRADLRGACLESAHFLACDFRRADLRDADLADAHFGYTTSPGYHVRLTDLTQARLDGAKVEKAVMDRVVGWPVS